MMNNNIQNNDVRKDAYWRADYMVSALGCGTDEAVSALSSHCSGLRRVTLQPSGDERYVGQIDWSRIASEGDGLTRLENLFVHCIRRVLAPWVSLDRTALVLSSTKGNVDLLGDSALDDPRLTLHHMASTVASRVGISAQPVVISNACISGISAIVVASRLIQLGLYDNVVVAGGDLLTHFVYSGFNSFKSVSAQRCRPYDLCRDGLSIGEACGAVLLSCHADAGSDVVVLGGAVSNDANHISGPSRTGDGLFFAIDQTMRRNHIGKGDIAFISAHGTATVYNDEMESKAVALAGLSHIPLNSTKAYTGHTLGACGVIESIISVWELRHGLLFGTLGYSRPGTPQPLCVSSADQVVHGGVCLKIASGFGGCNAAVAFARLSHAGVRAASGHVSHGGSVSTLASAVIDGGEHPFADYIRARYRALNEPNLKFFKMDNLCKLGYIACSQLLHGVSLPDDRTRVAVVLSNSSSSLDTDARHQQILSSHDDPSPAVFVYTLPNIVSGELCIRHKINGENTFFIQPRPGGFALDYAHMLLREGYADMVIFGWCELLGESYRADFRLLSLDSAGEAADL